MFSLFDLYLSKRGLSEFILQPFSCLIQVPYMDAPLDWDSIVEGLGPRLYRYFCARFEDVVADDLTQETLVRLVTKFNQGDFDSSKGTIEMFAFGIARFVRLEHIKERPLTLIDSVDESIPSDEVEAPAQLEKHSRSQIMRQGIISLGEPEQEIILLMIDQEWTLNQIAEHMKMPLGTIKSHVHRAKKNIVNFVNQNTGESYGRI